MKFRSFFGSIADGLAAILSQAAPRPPASKPMRRRSHGLDLVAVGTRKDHHGRTVTVMTHRPKGRRWDGPGVTGSVRRAAASRAEVAS